MSVSLDADNPPTTPPIVGRADELRLIADVVDAAIEGRGGAVVVRGEPGMGKSAILQATASRDDVAILRIDCTPRDRHRPRGLIADALDGWPAPGDRRPDSTDLADRLRAMGPMALVLDNLHWADNASADLLSALTPRLRELPVAIAMAVRDHEVPTSVRDALDRMTAAGVLSTVALSALDRRTAGELATILTGRPASSALAAEVAMAAGNPLHLIDICRSRVRGIGDDLPVDSHHTHAAGRSEPRESGNSAVALDGLSDDARSVLSVAALLGVEFGVRELCGVLGRSMTDLLTVMHEALDRGVVGDGGGNRLSFQDPAAHAALVSALPRGVRAELQRDIAGALHRAGAAAHIVAAHLARGNLQPSDIEWVTAVGSPLLAVDADLAAALWTRARAAVPEGGRRGRVVDAELARALLASGSLRRAEIVCRKALGSAAPGVAGSLRLTLATTLLRQGRWAAARAIGESAAASAALHPAERAEQVGIAATAALAAGDVDGAREAVDRAERAAQTLDVGRVRGYSLGVRGHLAHADGRLGEAAALLRDAVAQRTLDGPLADGVAPAWLAMALADMDQFDDADRILDDAEHACRGGPSGRLEILRARAALRLDAGLIRQAVDIFDSLPVPDAATGGPMDAVVIARRAMAALYVDGKHGADPWIDRLPADPAAVHACHGSAWIARVLAARCAVDGDLDGERRSLIAGWDACEDRGLAADLVVLGPHLAAACESAGERVRAVAVAASIDAVAKRNSGVATIQAAARVTEAFAQQDPEALVAAARMWQGSPRRLEAVRIGKRVSDTLSRLGHPQLARTVSAESSRVYMAQGARLNADGGGTRAHEPVPGPARRKRNGRPTSGWDALTRTERIVAQFVERGESNAEIAGRLVLSRRTVETHVSNILAKLGMRSRADLIIAAASRKERGDRT